MLLLTSVSSCGETTTDPVVRYSLRGRVTVAGEGVPTVLVTILRPSAESTVTDSDGRFAFDDLESGSYPVSISDLPHPAYFTEMEITVSIANADAEVAFEGNPLLEILTGSRALHRPFVDHPYADTLEATGGAGIFTWRVSADTLPTGLELNPATGEISGTPVHHGTAEFTLEAASEDGQDDSRRFFVTTALHPTDACDGHPDDVIASFEDPGLDAAVREDLFLGSDDDITCGRLAPVMVLVAESRGVESLMGLQNLPALTDVWLAHNSISGLRPLSTLANLELIDASWNAVSDLTGLENLTRLTNLFLIDNSIEDIGPLEGLTALEGLLLAGNDIQDLSALGNLLSLRTLDLGDNAITTVEALRDLTNLSQLRLHGNQGLVDIQPLIENTGIGSGDEVSLEGTGVDCADVAALTAKGVTVTSSCPA